MGVPAILSWSGGKDSALALRALRAGNEFDVVALVTSVTQPYDRISIHGVRRSLLERQAERLGLPLYVIDLPAAATNAVYEAAFHAALARVRSDRADVRHIAFGDLFLEDVRAYRERLLARTAFQPVFPIWSEDTSDLARRFIAEGFEARLVCVDTTQLDGAFAGRAFDTSLLDELPASTDPCGERGEFHTFVGASPDFDRPIPYTLGETVLRDGRFMYCDLLA